MIAPPAERFPNPYKSKPAQKSLLGKLKFLKKFMGIITDFQVSCHVKTLHYVSSVRTEITT